MNTTIKYQSANKHIEKAIAILASHFGIIPEKHYYIVLYFILLRKTGMDKGLRIHADADALKYFMLDAVESEIDRSDLSESDRMLFKEIVLEINPQLQEVFGAKIFELIDAIGEVDQDFFNYDFDVFFTYIFDHHVYQYMKYNDFILPPELANAMHQLAGTHDGMSVYNPFTHDGQFLRQSPSVKSFFGQERNVNFSVLSKMFVFALNLTSSIKIKTEDVLLNWPKDKTFDLIISRPPILKLNELDLSQEDDLMVNAEARFIDHVILENGMNSLKTDGKMVLLLSRRFLFGLGQDKVIKEKLIGNDWIDTIVLLPGNLFPNSAISTCLVAINKAKREEMRNKVRFIDASNIKEGGAKEIDAELLKQLIQIHTDDEFVKIVENNRLIENDCNLSVARYFTDDIEGDELRSFTQRANTTLIANNQKGKLVRNKYLFDRNKFVHLSNTIELDVDKIEEIDSLPLMANKLEESALLIATRSNVLRLAYFNYSGEPVYIRPDIVALTVNENKVTIPSLLFELFSPYVQKQYQGYLSGTTLPAILKSNLLSIKVKLRNDEDQSAIVDYVRGITEPLVSSEEIKEIKDTLARQQYNEFASLKHTLGAPRENILSGATLLLKFFENDHEVVHAVKNRFKEVYAKNLTDVISSIKKDIKFVSQVLERGENGLILEQFPLGFISFLDIYQYLEEIDDTRYKFRINVMFAKVSNPEDMPVDKHPLEGDMARILEDAGINGNRVLLRTLIENILENANKHGFDVESNSNEVKILIMPIPSVGTCNIQVWNNGKPFPKGYTKDKFITKYSTKDTASGTGLGGYDINRIIQYFGGDWNFTHEMEDQDVDPEFPVQYNMTFPIEL